MTNFTAETVPADVSRNPMTAFAAVAQVGDTFNGEVTMTAIAEHGPFYALTFTGYGETWTTDYPRRVRDDR